MPLWTQPRISCFYCGRSSKHRKGDGTRSFQCTSCEGTNFLDQHGNIADVPAQVAEGHSGKQLAGTGNSKLTPKPMSDTFCSQCINNQQIVNNCIANYFPSETDPRYQQFVSGFDEYKADLEKRYPQVCPRCEAKVKQRLKKTTYLAQTDTLSKKLSHSRASVELTKAQSAQSTFMSLAEMTWKASLICQAVWHAFGVAGVLAVKPTPRRVGIPVGHTGMPPMQPRGEAGAAWTPTLTLVAYYSFVPSILLIWWNPTFSRYGRLSVSKAFFYTFQLIMLLFRASFWYAARSSASTVGQSEKRAIHFVAVILTLFNLFATFRFITRAPAYKVPYRNINAPLVDRNNFQHFEQKINVKFPETSVFQIRNLKASDEEPPISPVSPTTPSPPIFAPLDQDTDQPSADAMDWEPSQPSHNLRPRFASDTTQATKPLYPSTSAFSPFPTKPGLRPFHGSLPPAPKSLEARLRSDARRPAPQFRPTSDAKQADWFKRMSLAQSSTSWAHKDYVHSVKRDDELPDFAPGKLGLTGLGQSSDTGLESMFGNNFKLDDDRVSHLEEDHVVPAVSEGLNWVYLLAMALILVFPLILAFIFRLEVDLAGLWSLVAVRLRRMAYGQGIS